MCVMCSSKTDEDWRWQRVKALYATRRAIRLQKIYFDPVEVVDFKFLQTKFLNLMLK